MKSKLKEQQKEMAYLGYYTVSSFAKFKKISKQFISRKHHKFETVLKYNRRWYKYDNGQIAQELYGNLNEHIDKFLQFGFKKRMKSLALNDSAVVDVKRIDSKYLSIRFYNEVGGVICCNVNVQEIEIIENDNNETL